MCIILHEMDSEILVRFCWEFYMKSEHDILVKLTFQMKLQYLQEFGFKQNFGQKNNHGIIVGFF